MRTAKFSYEQYKNDPNPKILILDDNYRFNGRGKEIPNQHDILGYNINYFKNKKIDEKKIKEIYNLAEKAKKEKLDIYKEIKEKYPASLRYIRHYKKSAIKNFKEKKGLLFFKA
jgi:hypothetical protein